MADAPRYEDIVLGRHILFDEIFGIAMKVGDMGRHDAGKA